MSFAADMADLGFALVGDRRGGVSRYALRSGPYLQWWVHAHADGTADLTWEVEIGSYFKDKGFHISVQDELSLLLFPAEEVRGPANAEWVAGEMSRAEERLRSMDLVDGL
jgi:hypothetical protein